jgi:hypothetical protein
MGILSLSGLCISLLYKELTNQHIFIQNLIYDADESRRIQFYTLQCWQVVDKLLLSTTIIWCLKIGHIEKLL